MISISEVTWKRHTPPRRTWSVLANWAASGCLYTPRDVPNLEHWLNLLGDYSFGVMLGVPLIEPEGRRNAYLYVLGRKHRIYRKINLFPGMNEPKVYQPGTELELWETGLGATGVTICYDLRFPDLYTSLAKKGATTILVPAAWPRVRVGDWKQLLVQRAKENRVRMIGINAVGNDGTNEFGGSTTVVESDGLIRLQADETHPMSIDLEI